MTENHNLKYNDGVTNLFLYTEGEVGGSIELKSLLKHMTNTTADNALDPDLEQIQRIVDSVKSNREVGERYMSLEKMIKSAEYHGRIENIKSFIEILQELNVSKSEAKSKLLEKFELSEDELDNYINQFYK